ncbi:hypothetical protein C8Q74DRAFT_255904 [Fomes fomentarius]|nr:hypothetical protein C8Q74DRAFT_255904 [Fomes fomentarius]
MYVTAEPCRFSFGAQVPHFLKGNVDSCARCGLPFFGTDVRFSKIGKIDGALAAASLAPRLVLCTATSLANTHTPSGSP